MASLRVLPGLAGGPTQRPGSHQSAAAKPSADLWRLDVMPAMGQHCRLQLSWFWVCPIQGISCAAGVTDHGLLSAHGAETADADQPVPGELNFVTKCRHCLHRVWHLSCLPTSCSRACSRGTWVPGWSPTFCCSCQRHAGGQEDTAELSTKFAASLSLKDKGPHAWRPHEYPSQTSRCRAGSSLPACLMLCCCCRQVTPS